jgi:hypothetical protein
LKYASRIPVDRIFVAWSSLIAHAFFQDRIRFAHVFFTGKTPWCLIAGKP